MTDSVSVIRAVGFLVGVAMMTVNFTYHRGPRWRRSTFGAVSLVALALIVVSLFPSSVNWLRDTLSLSGFAYGRLLALAIVASFVAILLALYAKARADYLHRLLDRVVVGDTTERALLGQDFAGRAKPIMIVIPALNEAENLERLLPRIPAEIDGHEVGVLVVDDGSTDQTSQVAAAHGCLVARNSVNRGQGAAFRVGYTILQRIGTEIAVTMDADNQHRPEDLPAMVRPVITGHADFVLGSRVLGSHDAVSQIRSLGIGVLSRLLSLLSGQKISDCANGFRVLRMARMNSFVLREDQFQNSEVILEAAKKGLRIREVPIHVAARSHGESRKGPSARYGFFFVKAMIKTWWR
jgi:hypothetical protein